MPEVSARQRSTRRARAYEAARQAAAGRRISRLSTAAERRDIDPHRRQPDRLVERRHGEIGGDIPLEALPARGRRRASPAWSSATSFRADSGESAADPRGGRPRAGRRLVFDRAPRARRRGQADRCGRSCDLLKEMDRAVSSSPRRPTPSRATASSRCRHARCCPTTDGSASASATPSSPRRSARPRACLVYHHHMGTAVQTEAEHRPLHAGYRRGGRICCSTPATPPGAAATRRGIARHYRARIGHVHCKDVRKEVMRQAESPRTGPSSNAVLRRRLHCAGDGLDRFRPRAASELSGYSGWLVVEAEQDPQEG